MIYDGPMTDHGTEPRDSAVRAAVEAAEKCQAALLDVCERPGFAFTEHDVLALARAFSGLMSTADAGKLWAVQEGCKSPGVSPEV